MNYTDVIIYLSETSAIPFKEEPGQVAPTNLITWLMLFATLLIFVGLAIWLMFVYHDAREDKIRSERAVAHRAAGSFVGFWGRNKHRIYAFLCAVFVFIAICLAFLLVGTAIDSSWTWD